MRVLHFVSSFSPLSQTFIYDYITELERQGVENHVLTFERTNAKERPFDKVSVIDKPGWWHPRRLFYRALVPFGVGKARTSKWPEIRKRLEAHVREVEPDVIHAHFGPAGVLIAPVSDRMVTPLVTTFYGYDISSLPDESFWEIAYDDFWPRVDAVTVLSNEMKVAAETLGCPARVLNIVHLSRDLDKFPLSIPDRPVQSVLFVGRLVPKKAPLDAVQAVERANQRGADLYLDLVGDGPLREEVEKYVSGNDLSDTVTVHGRVPNAEVSKQMQNADAFLLPSKTAPDGDREGTPTVLVEAQAVGLPCVTTSHAGIPEMIPEDNHNLMVPEGDGSALTDALCTLATRSVDELEQVAERGRKKVERDFSLSSEVQHLQKIYRQHTKNQVLQS